MRQAITLDVALANIQSTGVAEVPSFVFDFDFDWSDRKNFSKRNYARCGGQGCGQGCGQGLAKKKKEMYERGTQFRFRLKRQRSRID